MALPKFTPTLTDGNLERIERSGAFNKHVVILGTASDGPMYSPVTIRNLDHAESVFGSFSKGTLVKAINEAWQAQMTRGKSPLISGMRIGDSKANEAKLDLDSNDANDGVALTLKALYPGGKYNSISVVQDTAAKQFSIYNPLTDTWSKFKYDWDNPNNPSVHAHTIVELAAAINADPNLAGIMVATVPDKSVKFELLLNTTDDADIVTSANDAETVLNISNAGTGDYVSDTLYIDGSSVDTDPTLHTSKTIVAVDNIYAISDSGIEVLEAGETTVKPDKLPLAGRSDSRFNTLLNVISDSGVLSTLAKDPGSGDLTSESYFRVRNAGVGTFDSDDRSAEFDAAFAIADYAAANSGMLGPQKLAYDYHAAKGYDADYTVANLGAGFKGITRWNSLGEEKATGTYPIKVQMRKPNAAANEWDTMDLSKGTWTLSWSSSTEKVTLTIPEDGGEVNLSDYDDGDIRVSYDSCLGILTEKSTLAAVQASSSFTDYFVRGQEFVFGAALPHDLVVRYATVTYYELGSTVTITDANNGKLKISGADVQPGPGGGAIGADDVIIGFEYNYAPEAPVLTSTKTLIGGKDGTGLSKKELYDEVDTALDNLDALTFDILTIPGAYLDSTKLSYNPNTGLPETTNAGFHSLISSFLSRYNREASCVMGFEPITGTGPNDSITRGDVRQRVLKLTTVSGADILRAANYLDSFEEKGIVAVDLEGLFRGKGSRYFNTGEAAVAGHIAMLRDEETMYISPISGILGLRYRYADRMASTGKTQLDMLSDARINAAIQEPGGVRLVDGITLAAVTSDYHLESTLRSTNAAVRDVRSAASPFLGHANTIQNLQAMETAIDSKLRARVPASLISFSFSVKSSPAQRVIGEVDIPLTLYPVFEIRSINTVVSLSSS